MPTLNGREVLRRLRRDSNWTPVILLTRVGDLGERATALQEGADDYLNKPFDANELIARIGTILRRARAGQPSLMAAHKLRSGAISFNRSTRRVMYDGKEVQLTPKAVNLLEYLMTHPDELVSRERLLDVVWGWDYPAGIRTVDTRVAEIRKVLRDDPLDPHYIETIAGEGYRFVGQVEAGT